MDQRSDWLHRLAVAATLFCACEGVSGSDQSGTSGVASGELHLTLAVGDDEVDGIAFTLQPVVCDAGTPLGAPIQVTHELEDIWLPGGLPDFAGAPLDAASVHAFADAFFRLKPGCYDVTTQPMRGAVRVPGCQPATKRDVRIRTGETSEVFLLNQCSDRSGGNLDVVAAINRNPRLSLAFEDSKFTLACRPQTICATVVDPDRDPIELRWVITETTLPYSGPSVVSRIENADGSTTECIEVLGHVPGRYTFEVTAFDLVHAGGSLIRIEEWLAFAGYPSESRDTLTAFFYASGALPIVEVCENDGDDDCDGAIDENCGGVEIPSIGTWAGSVDDIDVLRARFDRADPPEPNNPNLSMYEPGSQRLEVLDDLLQTQVAPLQLLFANVPRPSRVPWNAFLGRQLASAFVQTDYTSNWPMPEGREVCVAPELMIDCCTYVLTEGAEGSSAVTTYYKPKDMFATAADAAAALSQVYAQMPIFLPYTDGDVKLSHGWIYNGADRNPHGSLDYSQGVDAGEDASFRVRAVASGTVVAKYWDAWHGNVLVIEHQGPGAFNYRSFYFHLRDGKSHDLSMALSETVADGDPASSRDKYLAFAGLDDPSDLHWGTNDHKILVDVGDTVYAHEHVAWSGNTGPGGAGAGLNEDGTPKNENSANNHLHFMVAVSHPTWTGGEWLYVDPYGVYEQQSSGCYDLLANTNFDRLLAPFYPYFHGVDLGVFNFYLYYYGQMGRSPATFTVQHDGSKAIAAGAFKPGLSSAWYVYDYLQPADFQNRWDTLIADDFRLTERSVTLDSGDDPRHNGVFRPDVIDDWFSFPGLGWPGAWQDKFDELSEDGYDLADFFAYHDGGANRVAAIFVPESGGFIHHAGLDSNSFTTVTNDHAENDGYLPVDVNVMELAGGTYLSAIYRQTGDGRMVHWGMTASEYQQWMDYYLSDGWDLQVVQNYADGSRYAAIWSK